MSYFLSLVTQKVLDDARLIPPLLPHLPAYLRLVCKVHQAFGKGSKLIEENYNKETQKWLSTLRIDPVQPLTPPKENPA